MREGVPQVPPARCPGLSAAGPAGCEWRGRAVRISVASARQAFPRVPQGSVDRAWRPRAPAAPALGRHPWVRLDWGGGCRCSSPHRIVSDTVLAPNLYSFFKKGNPNKLEKNTKQWQNHTMLS